MLCEFISYVNSSSFLNFQDKFVFFTWKMGLIYIYLLGVLQASNKQTQVKYLIPTLLPLSKVGRPKKIPANDLSICLCVCIHVYIYINTYTYICIHIHLYIHTHTHTNTYIHTYTHIHIHIYIYTYIFIFSPPPSPAASTSSQERTAWKPSIPSHPSLG